MALITKGIMLSYGNNDAGTNSDAYDAYFTEKSITNKVFPNLQEIGEVGITGTSGTGFDQIEVTTLADAKHVYVNGLMVDSDSGSNEISLKFLYEPALFAAFKGQLDKEQTESWKGANPDESHLHYFIDIPSAGCFDLTADIGKLAMDSISTNAALTFTLTLAVLSVDVSAENHIQ